MSRLEDVLQTLESLAQSYDKESAEYQAIREAALALTFVNLDKEIKEKFAGAENELSDTEKQMLRDMGITP